MIHIFCEKGSKIFSFTGLHYFYFMKCYHRKMVFNIRSKDTRPSVKETVSSLCSSQQCLPVNRSVLNFRKNMEGILDKSVVDCLLSYGISNNV